MDDNAMGQNWVNLSYISRFRALERTIVYITQCSGYALLKVSRTNTKVQYCMHLGKTVCHVSKLDQLDLHFMAKCTNMKFVCMLYIQ